MDGGRDHPRKDGNNTMYRFHFNDTFQKRAMRDIRLAMNGDQSLDGDVIGQARTGDICFDLVLRTDPHDRFFLGLDLYVGGIDDGYGYSAEDALLNGNYIYEHEVPAEELYPYTERDGCGGPLCNYSKLTFEELVEKLEAEMNEYIDDGDDTVKEAANRPFHFW